MRFDSRGHGRQLRAMLLFGTAGLLVLTAGSPAAAAGFYLQEQSVRGWGRANSGEVADQGPASLWWNPAAIGDGENGLSFGATAVFPSGRLRDGGTVIRRPGQAPAPVGGPSELRDPIQRGVAPNAAFALALGHRLALGARLPPAFHFPRVFRPARRAVFSGPPPPPAHRRRPAEPRLDALARPQPRRRPQCRLCQCPAHQRLAQ